MFLNPASFLQLVWSPTDWISCALSYIIVQRPPSSCGCHNFALIQPVHGQGYISIFLDRMHLLFTHVHFLFWQPSRVVGQYTTLLYSVHVVKIRTPTKKNPEVYQNYRIFMQICNSTNLSNFSCYSLFRITTWNWISRNTKIIFKE